MTALSADRPSPEGLLVVDKPSGLTSHDVVAKLRRVLRTRRVGHAGTLDPMATGVLVCGVGRATRLLGMLALTDKEYLATIRLGAATTTDDAEGEVLSITPATLTAEQVESALAPLRGRVMQRPSSVSAIKVDGRRAHQRVREGEEVVLAEREVTIEVLHVDALRAAEREGVAVTDVDVRVVCSSGTYVRAIARDAGLALGVGGHLTALRRTRVGRYGLAGAQPLEALLADPADEPRLLSVADVARAEFLEVVVDDEGAALVRNGVRVRVDDGPDRGPCAVFDRLGELLAISDVVDGRLVHRMVLCD